MYFGHVLSKDKLPKMISDIQIRQATPQDAESVAGILNEASQWLDNAGMSIWHDSELNSTRVTTDITAGLFFLAELSGAPAGTMMFQLEDLLFWPDRPEPNAAYLHRLAIRRDYAGTGLSTALLRWAVNHTQTLGRRYLRLDCFASRPRLRAIYENFGFQYQDDRQVGPYLVARYEYDVTEPTR
jgi:GNAT superfamily N-acetyltransferase